MNCLMNIHAFCDQSRHGINAAASRFFSNYLQNDLQTLGIYYRNQRGRTRGRRAGWRVQIRAAIARGRDVGLESHLADAYGQPAQPNF